MDSHEDKIFKLAFSFACNKLAEMTLIEPEHWHDHYLHLAERGVHAVTVRDNTVVPILPQGERHAD